jgi:hypothetical protein
VAPHQQIKVTTLTPFSGSISGIYNYCVNCNTTQNIGPSDTLKLSKYKNKLINMRC